MAPTTCGRRGLCDHIGECCDDHIRVCCDDHIRMSREHRHILVKIVNVIFAELHGADAESTQCEINAYHVLPAPRDVRSKPFASDGKEKIVQKDTNTVEQNDVRRLRDFDVR